MINLITAFKESWCIRGQDVIVGTGDGGSRSLAYMHASDKLLLSAVIKY